MAARSLAVLTATLVAVLVVSAPADAAPWAKRITGYFSVRHGTLLHYSVLLPKAKGRFPVVLNYSGYDAGSIGGAAYQQGNTAMWPALDTTLLKHGYAVLGVNMSGSGCSGGGAWQLFADDWGTDGRDAVEWASHQGWSDGSIGMDNWSYAGLSQVLTAITRPPNLKAIAPGMAVADPWRDVGTPGGVTNVLFPAGWWAYIQEQWSFVAQTAGAEGDQRCLANIAAHEAESQTTSPPADLEKYPYPTTTAWAHSLPWQHTQRINIPVLSMVAWEDEATGPRAGYYQRTLNPSKTYLIGTNGEHDSYTSLRFRAFLVKFFDRYLKGIRNGIGSGPHVQLWEDTSAQGAPLSADAQLEREKPGEVIKLSRLPVRVHPLSLALRSRGRLTTRPARREQPDSYRYPVPGPSVNADLTDNETEWVNNTPSRTGSVEYTTARLPKVLTFFGPASLDLWISSTAHDVDLQATITEVRPDGQEEYVGRGWLRLQDRKTVPALSTPLSPFLALSPAELEPVKNDKPVFARLPLEQFSHVFRRGSSIRVWIDTPSTTGEWGFTDPTQQSTIKIYHDPKHHSKLMLGLLRVGKIHSPLPACNTLVSEPCRKNPDPVPAGTGPNGSTASRATVPDD
jgi:putative CocE/NonD family hydrolase